MSVPSDASNWGIVNAWSRFVFPESDTFLVTDTGAVDTRPPPTDTGTCADPGGKIYGGHCYFLISKSMSWTAAKDACAAAASAHLVTITSDPEQSFVQTFSPGSDRWIGLSRPAGSPATDKTQFKWITGETSSYDNWSGSAPSGAGECARLSTPSNRWRDSACSTPMIAICERESI